MLKFHVFVPMNIELNSFVLPTLLEHLKLSSDTVSQNLKSHMNEGQRLNYILDRSLYDSKMIEEEKSIFYRPVF